MQFEADLADKRRTADQTRINNKKEKLKMKKQNLLTIWAKRAIPALALAGTAGVMLPSCEKPEPEQEPYREPYEKELFFKQDNLDSISTAILTHFSRDNACRKVYMHVMDDNNYTGIPVSIVRNSLQKRINVSSKISGRGDFNFAPGMAKEDSLWFVQNGWTVNKRYWDFMNQR